MARWTTADSEELYNISGWGEGFFKANEEGHLCLVAPGRTDRLIDLKVLIDDLKGRGITMPVLVRFDDLVRGRIDQIVHAFKTAIEEYAYKGHYRGVYPVKVNQQAHLVDAIVRFSRPHHLGLEAGSKPELQIVLAHMEDPKALIICNGYKDREYIQMALLARKLGRNCIIVVEKIDELDIILREAAELHVKPVIGVRAKLASKGSGRWMGSVGDRAKFGLTVQEIVELVEKLKAVDQLDMLRLLHFHIGSQVTNIRAFNSAFREATRMYTELARLGAPMKYIDVGGGLGVDYDGSRTNFSSSMNYSMQEYAYSVVNAIQTACDEAEIPHPDIITEAGRALVAHHCALIFDIVGTVKMVEGPVLTKPPEDAIDELHGLWDVHESINAKNLLEPYHDALEAREQALVKFNLGLINLEERAKVEASFWRICDKIDKTLEEVKETPEELEQLDKALADIYYCNFSVFQSAPDSWAINQLFPICPIHRLHEEPTRRAVLADLTCDSDGKIDKFIDKRDVKDALEVHASNGEPYYLGMFLVGAYQEILGDLHNLFGDTNAVHVTAADNKRGYRVEHVVEGDTIAEVLSYVQYDRKTLLRRLRDAVERGIESGGLSIEEGRLLMNTYIRGLEGYTYLGGELL